jgi:hypothetical protein
MGVCFFSSQNFLPPYSLRSQGIMGWQEIAKKRKRYLELMALLNKTRKMCFIKKSLLVCACLYLYK